MFMVLWSQVYHHSLSGSILNVSTVHLNGIWHLIWRYLSKPELSRHYRIPRSSCPLNTGFTVSKKNSHLLGQNVFLQSIIQRKQFIRTSNILAWGKSLVFTLCKHNWILLINRALFAVVVFNLIFALFLFLFISHYLKKSVHRPGTWQGVHGPGPWKWSMDLVQGGGPWTPRLCFVLTLFSIVFECGQRLKSQKN